MQGVHACAIARAARTSACAVPRLEPGVARRRVTFFASPKKVTKESRDRTRPACAALGCPCAARASAGRARNSLPALAQTGSPARTPAPPCAARRPRAASTTRAVPSQDVRDGGECRRRRRAVQGGAGVVDGPACLSDRRERVCRPARDPEQHRAPRRGAFAGAAFFGDFLCQDKESNGPRGPEAQAWMRKVLVAKRPERMQRASVPEVPHSGEHHRHAPLVSCRDDFLIAHAAARLDHAGGAGVDDHIEAITEREERVRSGCGACQ